MLPELMYRRLDELGIDFAVLYPTYGLPVTAIPNDRTALRARPSAQPLLRGGLRRLPRPARTGGRDPHLHARGGDRRARPRGRRARAQDGHARRHDPAALRRRDGERGSLDRHARPRLALRLRPGVAAVRGARRRADVPLRRPGMGHPDVHHQQLVQPGRQLRRRRRGDVPLAGLRRGARCDSRTCASPSRKAGWRGRPPCSRASSPTGRSATSTRSSTTTRPTSTGSCCGRLFDEHATGGHRRPSIDRLDEALVMLSDPDELAERRRPVRRVAAHQRRRPVRHVHEPLLLRLRSRRSDERARVLAGPRTPAASHCPPSSPPTSATGTCRDMREVLVEAYELVERRAHRRSAVPGVRVRQPGPPVGGMNPDFFHGTVVESAVAKAVA